MSAFAADGTIPESAIGKSFNPGHYAGLAGRQDIKLDILVNPDLKGVKIKYQWRELEPTLGQYDFSRIWEHLNRLKEYNKQIWIQIEYVAWSSNDEPNTPTYMWNDPSYGGDPRYYGNYERTVKEGGWYPLYWNSKVRARMIALAEALGSEFNEEPSFEGFSIPETSAAKGDGFDCAAYEETLKAFAQAAQKAFDRKHVFQMLNFACFDLVEYAAWMTSIGIGLGTPDTYTFKDSLTEVIYPLFLKYGDSVPVGPDVQWANYERNEISVAEIRDFAITSTNPWYMFWRVREPYFSEEVLRAVHSRQLPRAQKFYSSTQSERKTPRPPVLSGSP